jgi:RNA polymerase sigma factor (sigma-70 family)
VAPALVAAHFTGTETFGEILALIIERLPDLLVQAPEGVDVASRVARLTANYTSVLCEHSLDEAAIPMTTVTSHYASAGAGDDVADLLLRIRDGKPAAWDEILQRYGKLVSATVRSFRLQEADALDAVQMTWLRLVENVHRVQYPERLGGWLATTARRECLHILRQIKPGPSLTNAPIDDIPEPSSLSPPPTNVQAWEQVHEVLRLLDSLPPRQRQVMALTLAGYTPAEIASELDMTSEAIRSRLIRARRTLAGHLRPTGNPIYDECVDSTGNPRPYAEVGRAADIPPGAIGPTRARALQQLRRALDEHSIQRGSASDRLGG